MKSVDATSMIFFCVCVHGLVYGREVALDTGPDGLVRSRQTEHWTGELPLPDGQVPEMAARRCRSNTSIAQSSFLAAPTSADRAYLCDALLKHKCSSHFMLVQIQRSKPKQRIRDKGV